MFLDLVEDHGNRTINYAVFIRQLNRQEIGDLPLAKISNPSFMAPEEAQHNSQVIAGLINDAMYARKGSLIIGLSAPTIREAKCFPIDLELLISDKSFDDCENTGRSFVLPCEILGENGVVSDISARIRVYYDCTKDMDGYLRAILEITALATYFDEMLIPSSSSADNYSQLFKKVQPYYMHDNNGEEYRRLMRLDQRLRTSVSSDLQALGQLA